LQACRYKTERIERYFESEEFDRRDWEILWRVMWQLSDKARSVHDMGIRWIINTNPNRRWEGILTILLELSKRKRLFEDEQRLVRLSESGLDTHSSRFWPQIWYRVSQQTVGCQTSRYVGYPNESRARDRSASGVASGTPIKRRPETN
jgi:hypothetical protein